MKKKNLLIVPLVLTLTACGAQTDIPVVDPAGNVVSTETKTANDDPFEKITLVYEGLDSIGTCYYEVEDAESFAANGTRIALDKVGGLSNGDIVTVHVVYADGTDITKEYTVSGLEELPSEEEVREFTKESEKDLEETISEIGKATDPVSVSIPVTAELSEEEDPGDAEAVQKEVEAGIVPAVDDSNGYIQLSGGLMITPNIKLLKEDLKDGAVFVLDGLPAGEYSFVDFCSMGAYHLADDPMPDWAFSATYEVGDKADLSWAASTCDEYNNLYICLRPNAGGADIELNFPLE